MTALKLFADRIQDFMGGTPEVFLYFKGRVALHAVCRAIGLGPGDEVILSGYTCVVVPEAFIHTGAKPVYVDIDPLTFNTSQEAILNAITPATKMVIIQHTYGIPCSFAQVDAECRRLGIMVVQDACHAFGTIVDGVRAGLGGDAAFMSTQWNKPFSTGLGGILLVNNRKLAAAISKDYENTLTPGWLTGTELQALNMAHNILVTPRTYGWAQTAYRVLSTAGLVTGSSSTDEMKGILPTGYFSRMTEQQAAIGATRAKSFESGINHRKILGGLYQHMLTNTDFRPPPTPETTVFNRYPVRVANKVAFVAMGLKRGLEIGSWFETPLHPVPWNQHHFFGYTSCPQSEKAANEVINLPCNERTSARDAEIVVKFLKTHAIPV